MSRTSPFLLAVLAAWLATGTGALHATGLGPPLLIDGFESGTTSAWDFPLFCPGLSTYKLSESVAGLDLWTSAAARKVLADDPAPVSSASGLRMFAARREFEPVIVALRAELPEMSQIDTVTFAPFPQLGGGQTIDIRRAVFSGSWPERLEPLALPVTLVPGGAPLLLWITLFVPPDAPSGRHVSTLTLAVSGQPSVVVPVELYVFDATLPPAATFGSQLSVGFSAPAEAKKQLLFDHRLTPSSPTWPSGFRWGITWDQNVHPETRCMTLDDETDHESNPDYAVGDLAQRWVLGAGWNDVGFPSAELFRFVSNSEPRPANFCGIAREAGSIDPPQFGSAAYNAEWGDFLGELEGYLVAAGLNSKSYYYVMNEPQNPTDYNLAAHLCRLSKAAAPGLRLAISEQPRIEIAENAGGACGYDLWLTHFGELKREYAATRQLLGEEIWFYSLPQDFFVNPTVVPRQGMDVRMLPWIAWSDRARGWAYYDGDSYFSNGLTTVRLELLREGFEDYEYLWLANGGAHPEPNQGGIADPTARSAAHGEIDWNRDADAQAALRCELGRFLEGHRPTPPLLVRDGTRPRAPYYLNFQDPAGQPTADPLVVDGLTWMKIGWSAWDDDLGYGWTGANLGNTGIMLYGYSNFAGSFNVLERSYVYDDFGKANLFEFDIANGSYLVTVCVGRPGQSSLDPHNLMVEGIRLVDDELLPGLLVRSTAVALTDGRLSFVVGGPSETTGVDAYTFLEYVKIEPLP